MGRRLDAVGPPANGGREGAPGPARGAAPPGGNLGARPTPRPGPAGVGLPAGAWPSGKAADFGSATEGSNPSAPATPPRGASGPLRMGRRSPVGPEQASGEPPPSGRVHRGSGDVAHRPGP